MYSFGRYLLDVLSVKHIPPSHVVGFFALHKCGLEGMGQQDHRHRLQRLAAAKLIELIVLLLLNLMLYFCFAWSDFCMYFSRICTIGRVFVELHLPALKEKNPQLEVVTQLVRAQHPNLKGIYSVGSGMHDGAPGAVRRERVSENDIALFSNGVPCCTPMSWFPPVLALQLKCSKLQEPNMTGARQREEKIGHIPDARSPGTVAWLRRPTMVGALRGRRRQATTVGALRGSRPWLSTSRKTTAGNHGGGTERVTAMAELVAADMAGTASSKNMAIDDMQLEIVTMAAEFCICELADTAMVGELGTTQPNEKLNYVLGNLSIS